MNEKVLVAFDHTRVRLSDLEWAYKINAIYRVCLSNEDEEKPAAKPAVKGGK